MTGRSVDTVCKISHAPCVRRLERMTPRRGAASTTASDEGTPGLLLAALYVVSVFVPHLLVFPISEIDWDEYNFVPVA